MLLFPPLRPWLWPRTLRGSLGKMRYAPPLERPFNAPAGIRFGPATFRHGNPPPPSLGRFLGCSHGHAGHGGLSHPNASIPPRRPGVNTGYTTSISINPGADQPRSWPRGQPKGRSGPVFRIILPPYLCTDPRGLRQGICGHGRLDLSSRKVSQATKAQSCGPHHVEIARQAQPGSTDFITRVDTTRHGWMARSGYEKERSCRHRQSIGSMRVKWRESGHRCI
ncbi:hypothetical protein N658DRAFT_11085 [Parathielavia hyrcaniae]|uniref:Uncharacterized protein n=1 Tax=Parathielavia hyrcaniae TaxID=113614 RepID=A0AAN6Q9T4_9PEZI|nr:hypothetical protein N658DRAFT_11085 [Parathielavia hyrcaniae]